MTLNLHVSHWTPSAAREVNVVNPAVLTASGGFSHRAKQKFGKKQDLRGTRLIKIGEQEGSKIDRFQKKTWRGNIVNTVLLAVECRELEFAGIHGLLRLSMFHNTANTSVF